MMEDKELLEKILRKNQELTREEVEKRVEELLKEMPLLTRQGALLLLLGGEDLDHSKDFSITKIKNLTPGLAKVNVIGRVVAARLIEYQSGRRVYRIKIGDETGKVDVILWDEMAEKYVELGIKIGDVVKVTGASVRGSSVLGNIELILRLGGSMEKVEETRGIPKLLEFFKPISEALRGKKGEYIDAWAVILHIGSPSVIEKGEKKLSLVEAVVGDEFDNYLLNIWTGDDDKEYVELRKGEAALFSNLLVKNGDELSITSRTYIHKLDSNVDEEFRRKVEKTLSKIENIILRVFDVVEEIGGARLVIAGDGGAIYRMRIKRDMPLNIGDYIHALNSVKVRRRDRVYVYAEEISSPISVGDVQHEIPFPEPVDFSRLAGEDLSDIIVRGVLSRKTPLSISETRYGSRQVIQFWIEGDGGGVMSCVAWGEKAVEIDEIPEGSRVELRWVSSRTNRYGEKEIRIERHSVVRLI